MSAMTIKKMGWMGLALVAAAASGAFGAEDQNSQPEGLAIGVIGSMPCDQVERVRAFVEKNTAIAVRRLDTVEPAEPAALLEDAVAWVDDQREPRDACVVWFYTGDESSEEHAIYQYEQATAVVNVNALMTDDEEVYMRRLERLAMRSVGLLLDVPPVPNPQSAMFSYRTLEELDRMGRNFDPPSLMRLQENAVDKGIPLIKPSPFLMLHE